MASGRLKIGSNFLKIGSLYLRLGATFSSNGIPLLSRDEDNIFGAVSNITAGLSLETADTVPSVMVLLVGTNGGVPSISDSLGWTWVLRASGSISGAANGYIYTAATSSLLVNNDITITSVGASRLAIEITGITKVNPVPLQTVTNSGAGVSVLSADLPSVGETTHVVYSPIIVYKAAGSPANNPAIETPWFQPATNGPGPNPTIYVAASANYDSVPAFGTGLQLVSGASMLTPEWQSLSTFDNVFVTTMEFATVA